MIATLNIARDLLREAASRKWFLVLGVAITLVLATVGLSLEMDVVDGALAGTRLFGELIDENIRSADVALRPVFMAAAAFTFFQVASYQGLTLNNRRLKIGWGKNSGPLPPALALAVHSGATRNVYIGNIEDFESFNEDRLKRDFGEYGDIELVNFLKEK